MATKKIPDGYHTITPYLINDGVARTIAFLKRTFDATEVFPPMVGKNGLIGHAELRVGDSKIMMSDATDQFPAMPAMIHLYVEDVDASYRRAIDAGAISVQEPKDQFYGDRSAGVRDRAGNVWYMATHIEDVSPEEVHRRAEAAMASRS